MKGFLKIIKKPLRRQGLNSLRKINRAAQRKKPKEFLIFQGWLPPALLLRLAALPEPVLEPEVPELGFA